MKIEFVKVKHEEKDVLKNLVEFYFYDLWNLYNFNYDINENGRFELFDIDQYLLENNKEVFFIIVDGKKAGFIFLANQEKYMSIEEFWIMPKYRKGMLTYRILKQFFSNTNGLLEFCILNKNEKWLKSLEYMINRNNESFKLIIKLQMTHTFEWGKYNFTRFLLSCKNMK